MDDLLQIESLLTEDEILTRDMVKRFVDHEVLPYIIEAYEQAYFPKQFIKKTAELGLLGLTLPKQYGGAEASYSLYGIVCEQLEAGDSGLRSFVSVQSSLCMYPIYRYGNEEQKNYFLPLMAKGELIGCFGLTEADSGSDPGSMKTVAKKVPGGWLLNGSKMWITNAPLADIAIIWAKTDDGIRGFIVEKNNKGFKVNEIKNKMSLRASATGEVVLNDCFVSDSHYLPGSTKGLACPLSCLTEARYGIAWGAMGAAEYCFNRALLYAKERIQFDKPLAACQLIQKDLVDMYKEIIKTKLLNMQLGRLKDKGKADFNMVSLAKMNACTEALKIARKCRNMLGANGISLEYHVIRHMINLETVFTYEGTDNIHHLILGKYLTGLSAF